MKQWIIGGCFLTMLCACAPNTTNETSTAFGNALPTGIQWKPLGFFAVPQSGPFTFEIGWEFGGVTKIEGGISDPELLSSEGILRDWTTAIDPDYCSDFYGAEPGTPATLKQWTCDGVLEDHLRITAIGVNFVSQPSRFNIGVTLSQSLQSGDNTDSSTISTDFSLELGVASAVVPIVKGTENFDGVDGSYPERKEIIGVDDPFVLRSSFSVPNINEPDVLELAIRGIEVKSITPIAAHSGVEGKCEYTFDEEENDVRYLYCFSDVDDKLRAPFIFDIEFENPNHNALGSCRGNAEIGVRGWNRTEGIPAHFLRDMPDQIPVFDNASLDNSPRVIPFDFGLCHSSYIPFIERSNDGRSPQ